MFSHLTDWAVFLLPVMLFSLSMSATPGPNNVMLTASGANFGFVRSLPHMFGITIGVMLLMAMVMLGLGVIFERFPFFQTLIKVAGSVYLVWLGWKIAISPPPQLENADGKRPFSFFQAAAFQFVNPKAWMMAISAIGLFTLTGDDFMLSSFMIILAMGIVNFPAIACWAGFGVAIGRLLKTPTHWTVFNRFMGGLTASCVVMILI
ncbi:LysE family translocator [Nitrincola nitratireducens]|uniref:Cysteine/O-acetylserine efflux protein n=1 Tax=Nitrincola nitratireducens TaxID=1229521 RepID=W9UUL4_9GAMM|nr:LysE family translocator [Nitrincola nitratireducens]EXJ10779.1 Cysteine/O-acetylserine efflux protein [Nitrincola nitratireducens]